MSHAPFRMHACARGSRFSSYSLMRFRVSRTPLSLTNRIECILLLEKSSLVLSPSHLDIRKFPISKSKHQTHFDPVGSHRSPSSGLSMPGHLTPGSRDRIAPCWAFQSGAMQSTPAVTVASGGLSRKVFYSKCGNGRWKLATLFPCLRGPKLCKSRGCRLLIRSVVSLRLCSIVKTTKAD